jgi:hypothetical protein
MSIYRSQTFKGERVEICGNEYHSCKFIDCEIVFDASEALTMIDCFMDNPKMRFEGAAALTLSFLRASIAMRGDGSMRERMLEMIGAAEIGRANDLPA